MPVSTAAVFDLTTVERVRALVSVADADVESGLLQGLISACSRQVLTWTGRRTLNRIVTYTDYLDGSGTDTEFTRDYPIKIVTSVTVNGAVVPASPDGFSGGWINTDRRIVLAAGSVIMGVWQAFPCGRHNVVVVYSAGFDATSEPPGNTDYNGAPEDLGMAVTDLVATQYKRRDWMDQVSKTLAAGETITFRDWKWNPVIAGVIQAYESRFLA